MNPSPRASLSRCFRRHLMKWMVCGIIFQQSVSCSYPDAAILEFQALTLVRNIAATGLGYAMFPGNNP